jgi:hypothetical protein
MVEPWWVDCLGEALPILCFIFVMWAISRCMK